MDNLIVHPSRNLIRGAVFMLVVWVAATVGLHEGRMELSGTRSTW